MLPFQRARGPSVWTIWVIVEGREEREKGREVTWYIIFIRSRGATIVLASIPAKPPEIKDFKGERRERDVEADEGMAMVRGGRGGREGRRRRVVGVPHYR